MVEGYQGNNDPHSTIASCVKHFAGYGAPLAGKEYNTVELGERSLREAYLPAYKAAIDAGCRGWLPAWGPWRAPRSSWD